MGQYNCKQCDCSSLCNNFEFNLQSNILKVSDKSFYDTVKLPDHSLLSSPSANLCFFQYDSKSTHSLIRIQATWRAYIVRKQIEFIKKQFKTSFTYFTLKEVTETLTDSRPKIERSKHDPYIYTTGGLYVGSWNGGFREGSGIMIYRDSARYDGLWKYGRPSGRGRFTYTDGEVYDGMWNSYYVHPKEKIDLINKLKRHKESIPDGFCNIYTVWLWMKEQEAIQSFDSSIEGSIDIVSLDGSSLENTLRRRNESGGFLTGLFLNSVSTPKKITSVNAAKISEISLSRYGILNSKRSDLYRSGSDISKTTDTNKETEESVYENIELDIKTLAPMLSSRKR